MKHRDLWTNHSDPSMAFPRGFSTIEEWTGLFGQAGYSVNRVEIDGFVEGNFNQSAHV